MAAFAIPRPPTAFSLTKPTVKKKPREKLEGHLDFIRGLPCLVTGSRPVEAAHIRYPDMRFGKRPTGMGEKPDDQWVVPLSPTMHREQHAFGDELAWWQSKGIDPLIVALALWKATGDDEAGEEIIRSTPRNPFTHEKVTT